MLVLMMPITSSVFGSLGRESSPGQSADPAGLWKGSLAPTSLFHVCCGKHEVCSCAVTWKIERLQHLLLVNSLTAIATLFFFLEFRSAEIGAIFVLGFVILVSFVAR